MYSISAVVARKDLYSLIARVNEDCAPLSITTSKGKSAVLIGEEEWAAIEETIDLTNIPGLAAFLTEGMNEPLEECVTEDALEW